MFNWYVPLRGFDMTMAEDVYPYLNPDYDPKKDVGPVIKHADGRVSLSNKDVIAQIAALATKSINNSLQNRYVNQRFLNFIHNYYDVDGKDRLVTEVKHWIVQTVDPQTGAKNWQESFPDLTKKDANGNDVPVTDPAEVEQIVNDWQADMEKRRAKGEAHIVNERNTIPYKFMRRSNRSQHIVVAYQNGQKHVLIVNGNPRAAEAINGYLRPVSGNNIFNKIVRGVSQCVTTFKPTFVARNMARDAWFAGANNFINEGADYWRRYVGNYTKIATGGLAKGMSIGSLFYRYKHNSLNPNNADDMYFKEFMENGGETGWAGMEDIKRWQAKITANVKMGFKQSVKTKDAGNIAQASADKLLTVIKAFPQALIFANEHAENLARFATYMTSRKLGRSITRSIADAKEVSVNFNRKGAGKKSIDFHTGKDKNGVSQNTIIAARSAQWLRGNIMFYNAGMQGLNTFIKNYRYHPIKSTVVTGLFFALGGYIVPKINQVLQDWLGNDDDDDETKNIADPYSELPEYIRRQNLCLYTGKGNFLTIPLPIELRAIYGIGDLAASYTNHPELQNGENPVLDIATQLSQIFPVDFLGENNSAVMALVPIYIKPFTEAGLPTALFGGKENGLTEGINTRWNGLPIRRERTDWNEDTPKWQRAYTSTSDQMVGIAKWLDRKTNKYDDENVKGWIDIDPAAVQHIFSSYLGGISSTAFNLAALVKEIEAQNSAWDALKTVGTSQNTPVLQALHYKPTESNRYYRTRSKWFAYKDKADKFNTDMKQLAKHRENWWEYAKTKSKTFERDEKIAQDMEDAMKDYKDYTEQIKNTSDLGQKNAYTYQRDTLMYNTVEKLDKLK